MKLPRPKRRRSLALTPLIDVVFLLLVFFLLASTFDREDRLTVRLAGSGGGAGEIVPLRVLLLGGGVVAAEGFTVPVDEVAGLVEEAAVQGRAILVVPERDVALEVIVVVLDRLAAAGVQNVSLAWDG